jgi:hypothetical protein
MRIQKKTGKITNMAEEKKEEEQEDLQRLVDRYYVTEEEIDAALSGLRNYCKECHCDNRVVFKQIVEGDFDEILQRCLSCGGTIV